MPNSAQAVRRVRKARTANLINKSDRSMMRTSIKKFLVSIANNSVKEATELYRKVQKLLDTLAKKGVIASNTAARQKSRLNSKLKAISTK